MVDELCENANGVGHQSATTTYGNAIFEYDNQSGPIIKTQEGTEVKEFDAIIPRMAYLYLHLQHQIALYARNNNIFMLNGNSIINFPVYDKSIQYSVLSQNKLPIIPSLLNTRHSDYQALQNKFGSPFIYKDILGYCGEQVYRIENQDELAKVPGYSPKSSKNRQYLAQYYWPIKFDYRILVLGQKAIGAMKRIAGNDQEFRTNFSLGGQVEKVELTPELEDLAVKAAGALRCDFAGIDIMQHQNRLYIIEVNRYCGFQGFNQAHQINVAGKVIDYVSRQSGWAPDMAR